MKWKYRAYKKNEGYYTGSYKNESRGGERERERGRRVNEMEISSIKKRTRATLAVIRMTERYIFLIAKNICKRH